MNRGDAAEHLVARQLQPQGHIAAALGLAHRFHAATHDFLLVVAAGDHPDAQDDHHDDQERERENQHAHSESSSTTQPFEHELQTTAPSKLRKCCALSNIEIGN